MAWNVKYYAEWWDFVGYRNRVEFLVEDTVETPEEVIMKEFKIKYPEIDFFGEDTMYGSGIDMMLISPTILHYLTTLYQIDPFGMQVRHYLLNYEGQAEYLNFIGYLDTEQYEDPIHKRINYEVSVTANNGISILERLYMQNSDEYVTQLKGVYSQLDILKFCFSKLKIDYDFIYIGLDTYISGVSFATGINILHKSYIRAENFYDEKDEAFTCKEAVHNILLSLGAKLYIHNNSIYIIDTNTLYKSNFSFIPNDTIFCSALFDDGYIVGGAFSDKIAKIKSDGTRDISFVTTVDITNITSIAVVSNNTIWIGGYKTEGDNQIPKLFHLSSTGELIQDCSSLFISGYFGTVNAIEVQPDGKILIGTTVFDKRLFRINSDGTLDFSFTNYIDPSASVLQIKYITSSNKIIIGTTYTGFLYRLNSNGTIDDTFIKPAVIDNAVQVVELQPDGKILVGVLNKSVYRLTSSGELDGTFSFSATGTCYFIRARSDGKLFIGGSYTIPCGIYNTDGSFFEYVTLSVSLAYPRTITIINDNNYMIGGSFSVKIIVFADSQLVLSGTVGMPLQKYIFSSMVYEGMQIYSNIFSIDERIEQHPLSMTPGKNKVSINFNKYCYPNPYFIPISNDTMSGYLDTFNIMQNGEVVSQEFVYASNINYEALNVPLTITFVNKKGASTEKGGEFFTRIESTPSGMDRLRIKTERFITSSDSLYIALSGQIMFEDPDKYGVEWRIPNTTYAIPIFIKVGLFDAQNNQIAWYELNYSPANGDYYDPNGYIVSQRGDHRWVSESSLDHPIAVRILDMTGVWYNKWYELNGDARLQAWWAGIYNDFYYYYGKMLNAPIIPLSNIKTNPLYSIPGGYLVIDIHVPATGAYGYRNLLIKDFAINLLKRTDVEAFVAVNNTDAEFQGYINPLFKSDKSISTKQGTDLTGDSRGALLLNVNGTYIDSSGLNQRYVHATEFDRGMLQNRMLEELLLNTYISNLQISRYVFNCKLKGYYSIFTNFMFPILRRTNKVVKMIPIYAEIDYVNSMTSFRLLEYVNDSETIEE